MSIRTIAYGDNPEKVEYIGTTLCEREENYYDDSDGYSHVYDEGVIRRIGTWTTRAYSLVQPGHVDAYDEDAPLYAEMKQAHIDALVRLWLLNQSAEYDHALYVARQPKRGDRVSVVRGRKVAKGTEGILFWSKPDEYSYNYATKQCDRNRIGIKDDEGNAHWTTDNNVEVIDPDVPDPADYIGEVEYREQLADLTLQRLHGMFCGATTRLRR